MGKKWRWGVIFDAGSSGTRLFIYKWKDAVKAQKSAGHNDRLALPKLKLERSKKIRPGVSAFAESPTAIGPDHLQSLVGIALNTIPADRVTDTPVFLMATAGMRLLPEVQQAAILREICSYFQQNTRFYLPDCQSHIQVIPGETEGLYGWLAANYLLGGFDHADKHQHGKGHHTYGFLDMGGASAQIAFAPNATEAEKHASDLKLVRLRSVAGSAMEYEVFTASWLGFGVDKARERYVDKLLGLYDTTSTHQLPDPCLPDGLKTTLSGDLLAPAYSGSDVFLVGTGSFKDCLIQTKPLLEKDAPCPDEPCLLNGQHVPSIDFEVNHFVGVSEYWHTTHGVFGTSTNKAYDITTYQKTVNDFCSQNWADIEAEALAKRKDATQRAKDAQEACFKASWLINVLYEGIGIPRFGLETLPPPGLNVSQGTIDKAQGKGFLDPFHPVDKIDGIEVSWTLGKMMFYACGQVPPNPGVLPVGFGSNVAGIPPDFEHASSIYEPPPNAEGGSDWSDTADELLEKASTKSTSGILLLVILLLFLGFLLRKRERRIRLFGKISGFLRRHRRPGSPRKLGRGFSLTSKLFGGNSTTYERVMEEGELEQFDLVGRDSEDSESSEGSRGAKISGLLAPKLTVERFEDVRGGSAIDRSGLVVRTESRERLIPTVQMLNAGRRSRAGSPTRLKNSLMASLQEP